MAKPDKDQTGQKKGDGCQNPHKDFEFDAVDGIAAIGSCRVVPGMIHNTFSRLHNGSTVCNFLKQLLKMQFTMKPLLPPTPVNVLDILFPKIGRMLRSIKYFF